MMHTPEKPADYSAWDDETEPLDLPEAPAAQAVVTLFADASARGERLDKWLARQMAEHSRSRLQGWIEDGAVTVNGGAAVVRHAIWEGDRVSVTVRAAPESLAHAPEAMDLAIVFEDDDIIVINKPAGLVVHPAAGNWSGTLLNGLLFHFPGAARLPRAGIVHRLDKDTSGLMVVAKTEAAQTDLVRQLQARTVKREYRAVVHGEPPARGTIDQPIGRHPRERTRMAVFKTEGPANKPAVTHFRVLDVSDVGRTAGGKHALVACRLETGRTHQIRVHMLSLGHPLVGDSVYGKSGALPHFHRQALHARRLGLVHPRQRTDCAWSVPMPADMLELLEQLGLHEDGHDD